MAFLAVLPAVHAKKVKFSVDMTGLTVSPNGVHVTGDFQTLAGYPGGDWASNTTLMTGDTVSNIYWVVVDIPAFRKYEFKFINGDQFYETEFVPVESRVGYNFNDNRWIYIDSLANDTTDIGAIRFSGNAPAGLKLMRFKVDVGEQPGIDPEGVHVFGDMQGWDTTASILYSFGVNVYEVILYGDSMTTYAFRYLNGNTNASSETVPGGCATSGDRTLYLEKDTVLDAVCFSGCVVCVTAGLEETTEEDFLLYPNPATGNVTIGLPSPQEEYAVYLTDAWGREVRTLRVNSGSAQVTVSLEGIGGGMYLVQLVSDKMVRSTKKLMITD